MPKSKLQIKVGQVWNLGGLENVTIYEIVPVFDSFHAVTCRAGYIDPAGYCHTGIHCCWVTETSFVMSGILVKDVVPDGPQVGERWVPNTFVRPFGEVAVIISCGPAPNYCSCKDHVRWRYSDGHTDGQCVHGFIQNAYREGGIPPMPSTSIAPDPEIKRDYLTPPPPKLLPTPGYVPGVRKTAAQLLHEIRVSEGVKLCACGAPATTQSGRCESCSWKTSGNVRLGVGVGDDILHIRTKPAPWTCDPDMDIPDA